MWRPCGTLSLCAIARSPIIFRLRVSEVRLRVISDDHAATRWSLRVVPQSPPRAHGRVGTHGPAVSVRSDGATGHTTHVNICYVEITSSDFGAHRPLAVPLRSKKMISE